MKRFLYSVSILFLFSISLIAGSLGGTVTDSESGDPLSGATVIVSSGFGGSATRDTMTTGTDGTYLFESLTEGIYTVTVSLSGYETFTRRNVTVGEDEVTVDVELEAIAPATGVISGTVTDSESGDPLSGATVVISSGFGGTAVRDTVTTGADGTFSFEELAAGTYTVTVSLSGYETFTRRNVTVREDEVTVDVELDAIAPATGVISGTVTDSESGDPLSGAIVVISSGFGVTAVLDTVKTGADGTFSVGQLQAGNYRVTISAEGYRAFTQRNVNVEDDEVTVDAELRPSGSAVLTPLKYTSRTNGVFVQNNKLLVQSMAESAVLSLYSVNGVLIYREKIQKGLSVIDLWQITSGKTVVSILNAGAQRYVNTFLIP